MLKKTNYLIVLCLCVGAAVAIPQFWKLNTPSERDLFIMDVKTTMSAGICYKQVEAKVNDPGVRMRTVSYCCPGYVRNRLAKHMVKCDPICTEDCSNGICAGPEVCECFPGYVREDNRCISIY